ncbi:MAG: hypothetical protein ACF8PN_11855 [Phycisphaerales bacterium]
MEDRPPLHFRLLATAGLTTAFVLITSLGQPASSSAAPTTTSDSIDATELGRLRGDEYTIRIIAGSLGPRYEILDRSGRAISAALSYAELRERRPELADLIDASAEASATVPPVDLDH